MKIKKTKASSKVLKDKKYLNELIIQTQKNNSFDISSNKKTSKIEKPQKIVTLNIISNHNNNNHNINNIYNNNFNINNSNINWNLPSNENNKGISSQMKEIMVTSLNTNDI